MASAARFLACATAVGCVRGAVYPLDDSAPIIQSGGKAVGWTSGWDAYTVGSSLCIRLNQRGVYALPAHWSARDLATAGWDVAGCLAGAPGSLCATSFGAVFPAWQASFNGTGPWGALGCSREADGRALRDDGVYDVSACDVLDEGGDAVVCGRTLAYKRTGLATWAYWTVCALAVYTIRSLSYLVVRRLDHTQTPLPAAASGEGWMTQDDRTVLACLACVVLCLVPAWDSVFVTVEERLFVLFACVYLAAYMGVWVSTRISARAAQEDPPIYNLIAGTLQFVACRLYAGVQTPYNPVLVWAIATRALVKMRGQWRQGVGMTVLLDALLLSLLCVLGFDYSACYLVALFSAALATSDIF